ncbi:MAG TPA: carboxypeptidase-like regulatory domain-containing protein [Pyrinomonadaceae bacterium]|nr:carboxypeptidase-like regulatory domain-containing protein [Pyrinomonadaceae bacterium]
MRKELGILSLALVLLMTACDGFTHIKAKVTDMKGKPIQGALVQMKTMSGGRDDQSKTGTDGSFSVGFSHAPWSVDLLLTVSKDGYKTFEKRFKSEEGAEFPTTIILQPVQRVDESK